jgi:methylamine dehydrogenase accessory protein MauD
MTSWWIILFVLLWLFVIGQAMLLWGALRQVGHLHRRIDALRNEREGESDRPGLEVGTPAPDFTLPRLGGGQISLHGLRGRTIVLAFIQPACGPCKELLPHLNALATRCATSGIEVVLVSHSGIEANEALQRTFALTPMLLIQSGREVAAEYRAHFTPFVYAIDQRGVIRAHRVANTEQHLAELLASVTQESVHQGSVRSDAPPSAPNTCNSLM